MDWLNYHHLHYFWVVARQGSIARACEELGVAQPTISAQIRQLERSLGQKLFEKVGRNLQLTDSGRLVRSYADDIFTTGRELVEAVREGGPDRPKRFVVGITDVLPKMVAHRLLKPALESPERIRFVCVEGKAGELLAELATHQVHLVLTDAPMDPNIRIKAYNHLLGRCGVSILGTPELAGRCRPTFPASLNDAPMLLPTPNTSLRQGLDQWFASKSVSPTILAEFEDSALLKVFGQEGVGLFPVPRIIDQAICRQYGCEIVGSLDDVEISFYAISIERRIRHPAVLAISEFAHQELFS